MVSWWKVVLLGLVFIAANPFAEASSRKKRFIVHYKVDGLRTLSGKPVEARSIIKADSVSEARANFSLGSSSIVEVEEDLILKPTIFPNDTFFNGSQWHYWDNDGGIELPDAWDITTGGTGVVVAVIDTGILNHPDLQGKILPGVDLIGDTSMSNDGDGRDTDATDAGDWLDPSDFCSGGSTTSSTWHGTHVAGTVGATTNNSLGVSGVSWGAKILPVRVLGKCGGYLSDIADGIRWAAGGAVSGVPSVPASNRADVINLSLGGAGGCSSTIQSAIDFANSQGVVVVVAAGNDNSNLDFQPYVPATCRGVITVGAGNRHGFRSFYSNYGDSVDVIGPGGDFDGKVMSTSNDGTTIPNNYSYKGLMGTSMAAPHIAGVVALIKGEYPGLFPAQVEDILKKTTKGVVCNSGCGDGLVDAYQALVEASITAPDSTFRANEPLTNGRSANDNEVVTTYEEDGGMCGSVAFVDNPKPPRGGMGAFYLSLVFGLMIGLSGFRPRKTNQKVS